MPTTGELALDLAYLANVELGRGDNQAPLIPIFIVRARPFKVLVTQN